VKLEEYEISSRTQLTFEERESERKLDKEKEEEIEEYIYETLQGTKVCMCLLLLLNTLCRSAVFSHYQKMYLDFVGFVSDI